MVIQNQLELGEGLANPTDPHHTPTIIHSSTRTQKTQKTRKPKRKDTQVPQPSNPSEHVADKVVHKELGDSLAKKLEKKSRSRTHILKRLYKVGLTARVESFRDEESLGEDASKQGRINAIDADEEITLVSVQDDADKGDDDIQAKIDDDHQLAERLQAQKQEELSDAEKATLFQQLLEKRRKHFAAKRAEEKRNKPPTKA
ncbi:hypothetical protein Tco_0899228 [Tanacetum coccineum]